MGISCRLCPPPHLLGAEGFWLCSGVYTCAHLLATCHVNINTIFSLISDVSSCMTDVERHFSKIHGILDQVGRFMP